MPGSSPAPRLAEVMCPGNLRLVPGSRRSGQRFPGHACLRGCGCVGAGVEGVREPRRRDVDQLPLIHLNPRWGLTLRRRGIFPRSYCQRRQPCVPSPYPQLAHRTAIPRSCPSVAVRAFIGNFIPLLGDRSLTVRPQLGIQPLVVSTEKAKCQE